MVVFYFSLKKKKTLKIKLILVYNYSGVFFLDGGGGEIVTNPSCIVIFSNSLFFNSIYI